MSGSRDSGTSDDEGRLGTPDEQDRRVPDVHALGELSAMITSIGSSGPMHHPIFGKFESEHVTMFLEHAHKSDESVSKYRSSNRWFRLGYVGIIVFVFVFLTLFLLPDQSVVYFDILKGLALFLGGAGGGYGLRTLQDQRRAR